MPVGTRLRGALRNVLDSRRNFKPLPTDRKLRPDYEAIVATCCEAWNWLAAAPDRLASITRREWAKPVTN